MGDLKDVTVTSKQYYLLVDPAVTVLASSPIHGNGMDWITDVEMPVAWKRRWGLGRVFYCGLGHTVDVLQLPSVETMLKRALAWACRGSQTPF